MMTRKIHVHENRPFFDKQFHCWQVSEYHIRHQEEKHTNSTKKTPTRTVRWHQLASTDTVHSSRADVYLLLLFLLLLPFPPPPPPPPSPSHTHTRTRLLRSFELPWLQVSTIIFSHVKKQYRKFQQKSEKYDGRQLVQCKEHCKSRTFFFS